MLLKGLLSPINTQMCWFSKNQWATFLLLGHLHVMKTHFSDLCHVAAMQHSKHFITKRRIRVLIAIITDSSAGEDAGICCSAGNSWRRTNRFDENSKTQDSRGTFARKTRILQQNANPWRLVGHLRCVLLNETNQIPIDSLLTADIKLAIE